MPKQQSNSIGIKPMRHFGKHSIVAVAAVVMAVSAACSSASTPTAGSSGSTAAGALTPINVKFGNFPGVDSSMIPEIGIKTGVWAKDGISASLVTTTSGPVGNAAMLSGDIDVAANQPAAIMTLINQGKNVKMVLGDGAAYPYNLMVGKGVSQDNAGKYPEAFGSLKGKIFGVDSIGGATYNIVTTMLSAAGISADSVKFAAIGGGNAGLAKALQAGVIDAFLCGPADRIRLVDAGTATTLLDFTKTPPPSFTPWVLAGYFGDGSRLAANPEMPKRLQKGWEDTLSYMKDSANRTQVVSIIADYLQLTTAQAGQVLDAWNPILSPTINPLAIDNISKFLVANKLLKTAVSGKQLIWSD